MSTIKRGIYLVALVVIVVWLQSPSLASASTKDTRPSAPRNVSAVSSTGSVKIHFERPSSNGGSQITYYRIHIYPTIQVLDCRLTDCAITGLTSGRKYFFAVDAVNKIGAGPFSKSTNKVTAKSLTTTVIITFNANGGSGTMADETESGGVNLELTPNTFNYPGYVFNGWNTAVDGTGTNFTDGEIVDFTANAILYAQWIVGLPPTTATITFSANGGTGTMAPETENINVSAALTNNAFTKSGYAFSGWNSATNGTGTSFTNGELVDFTVSTTFYAQWTVVASFTGSTSSNWSGYVLPTTTLDILATGEWTVPILNCADIPNGSSSTWVGIGGVTWPSGGSSGSLLQTGTEDDCANGVQVDAGWFEIVPSTPNYEETFSNFQVSPGNSIEAIVGYVNGQWVTDLENLTTGLSGVFVIGDAWEVVSTATSTPVGGIQGYATSTSYSGAYSVEWIEEDVTNGSNGSLFDFPNYGTVAFTDLRTSLTSWSLPNSDAYEIMQDGATLSVPSAVFNDGFTVNYTGQ